MRILLDVMGGDLPPEELVKGGVDVGHRQEADILFAGDPVLISRALASVREAPGGRFDILPCSDIVRMDDPPVRAVREKRDSSMIKGLQALQEGSVDAFVSPGNTGAIVVGALLTLGRIAGIPRPGLSAILPTLSGPDIAVIDVGANSDCTATHLEYFGLMGATYARDVLGIQQPRIGLLNIGTEAGKGNRLVTQAHHLLATAPYDFVGNVEPHQILVDRPVDVVVCDGFVGNILLKAIEGGISTVTSLLKRSVIRNALAQLGGLLLRRTFRTVKETLSYQRRGGAPLLGVNGVVVIAHGRSDAEAIGSAIEAAIREADAHLVNRLGHGLEGWSQHGG